MAVEAAQKDAEKKLPIPSVSPTALYQQAIDLAADHVFVASDSEQSVWDGGHGAARIRSSVFHTHPPKAPTTVAMDCEFALDRLVNIHLAAKCVLRERAKDLAPVPPSQHIRNPLHRDTRQALATLRRHLQSSRMMHASTHQAL